MRSLALVAALVCALVCVRGGDVLAWGQEGHSIIAEIAQQRLSPPAAQMVAGLLKGRSLASIASWADDARDVRPETAGWHFVDIPLDVPTYKPARDCKMNPEMGDCIIAELGRLANDLRCTSGEAQAEALKFAVHFVGDIHQPLHTVAEKHGGNDVAVDVFMRGLATGPSTPVAHTPTNLHVVWDSTLIQKTTWAGAPMWIGSKPAGSPHRRRRPRIPPEIPRCLTRTPCANGPRRPTRRRTRSGICGRPTTCSTTAICETCCRRSSTASSASPACGSRGFSTPRSALPVLPVEEKSKGPGAHGQGPGRCATPASPSASPRDRH